ncbi:MAG TPA: YtxH domain-containing protein [Rubricoccaceae bacterium]|nr:YtxH domain-containing protein [Rubricoccaceae bacterium]
MSSSSRFGTYLAGTLAVGAAGFVLGLLLAPREGRYTRDRVAFLLDRWTRQLGGFVDRLDDGAADSEGRRNADAVIADARQQARELLHEADALMSEVRQRRAHRDDPR